MDAATLLSKLEQLRSLPREAATVEFKSNWDHPEDIGEYLSALGNAAALERHDRAWMVRRMFEMQRERFFPLPDYAIDNDSTATPRVEVTISGKILDVKYTQVLMHRSDLSLRHVILLDRVQKQQKLSADEAKLLKAEKLIEGRSPNYYISAKVADLTAQKARYIRNRALNNDYYRRLVVDYLQQFGRANRKELDELLILKLSDVLDDAQKMNKVKNLVQVMRREQVIRNTGTRNAPVWVLDKDGGFSKPDSEEIS